jgi:hypothetical protein
MLLVLAAGVVCGQTGGRFDAQKRQAVAYLDSSQFDRAAGKLEEVWDEDKSDLSVAEDLVLAYLNGDDRREHEDVERKARDLMDYLAKSGGSISFLVQHSHEKLGFISGSSVSDYCSGRLTITPDKLTYIAQARKGVLPHSFALGWDEIRLSGPERSGAFSIKTKAKNYTMITRTRIKSDGELVTTCLLQHLGTK